MSAVKDYWFPWYPTRYKADTMHLTALQDGIYRRLIDHYMETKCPLPDNDGALARIAGVTAAEFAENSSVIRAFFTPAASAKGGKLQLYLKKCDAILKDQEERRLSHFNRGKKGGRPKSSAGKKGDAPQSSETKKTEDKKDNKNNGEKATAKLTVTTLQDITEQDKKDTHLARDGFRKIFDEGSAIFPGLATRNTAAITRWLEAGADPDQDILPELRRAVGRDIRAWGYFDGAIADALAQRTKPMPTGKVQQTTKGKPHGNKSDRAKAAVLAGLGLTPEE